MRFVVLALMGLSSFAVAAPHAGDALTPTADTARRKTDLKTPEPRLKFVSEAFSIPQRVVERKYDEPLFQAMEKLSKDKSETEVATVIARLYGWLDTKELPTFLEKVQKEKASEEGKKERMDEKWVAVLDRVLRAAPLATGDEPPKNDKLKEFDKAFLDARKDVVARNKDWNDDLEKSETNAKAKENVQRKADPDLVLGLAAKHAKLGNDQLATKIAKAFALDGGNGNKYIEMIGGENAEAQRLYIGKTPADFVNTFKVASQNLDNFSNTAWYPKQHESPAKSWYVNGDKWEKGAPTGAEPPVAAKPASPPAGDRSGASSPPPPSSPPSSAPSASGGAAAVEAAVKTGLCANCHGKDGAAPLNFSGSGASATIRGKSLKAALEAGAKSMAMGDSVKTAIKALLEKL